MTIRSVVLTPFLLALSFLTRIPANPGETSTDSFPRSLAFFPVIGLMLGAVLCGAALRNKGVQQVLDAVVDFLPSPSERPQLIGTDPKSGKEVRRALDEGAPLCALAFKTVYDKHGEMTFLRVYSGKLIANGTARLTSFRSARACPGSRQPCPLLSTAPRSSSSTRTWTSAATAWCRAAS